MLALILDVCLRAGELDIGRFYDLPPELQALHLEHATNEWTGAYQARKPATGQGVREAMAIQAEGIRRAQGGA